MLNQAQIIGHLGRDPEIRYMPNGNAVANLAIATTEKWKDKEGNKQEATEWHRVSVFDKLAEVCGEYLRKGSLVYISGKIKTRKYTDKDGVEKYATEIQANEMKMLGGKPDGQQPQRQAAPQQQAPRPAPPAPARQAPPPRPAPSGFDDMDDDIPFRDPMANKAFAMCVC